MIEDMECSICYNQACKVLDLNERNHHMDLFKYRIIVKNGERELHKKGFCKRYKKRKRLEKMGS